MKSYGYVARDLTGILKRGLLQAACSNEVLDQLRRQGFTPISVKEVAVTARKKPGDMDTLRESLQKFKEEFKPYTPPRPQAAPGRRPSPGRVRLPAQTN